MAGDVKMEEAVRKLEDTVDILTDMAQIKRRAHSHSEEEKKMEISPCLVKEAIEAFDLFDKTKNNGLDIHELATVFRAVGQNPTDAELKEILKKYDQNGNDRLERDEFEEMIAHYMKPTWQVEQELKDAFRVFDKDGNGTIDAGALEDVLKRYGEPLSYRQSKELISLMDVNGDGRVDISDFVKFLCEVDQPDFFRKNFPGPSAAEKLNSFTPPENTM